MEDKTIYTIKINQNVKGKEEKVTEFNFVDRKLATDSFKGLKETCKIMSTQHYTIIRLFKNDIELAKFSYEFGANKSHSYKADLIGYKEVYEIK